MRPARERVSRCSARRLVASIDDSERLVSVSLDLDRSGELGIFATPLGLRASKSSSTRGRPCVMSSPATPPVWNVRMRELRARLADRLRGDDADRVADSTLPVARRP